jgi:hypothetical protein
MLVYYLSIRSILWLFGILCGHLVYFSCFGLLYQEKSGKPAIVAQKNVFRNANSETGPVQSCEKGGGLGGMKEGWQGEIKLIPIYRNSFVPTCAPVAKTTKNFFHFFSQLDFFHKRNAEFSSSIFVRK